MKGKGEISPVGIVIVGLFLLHWFSAVLGWDYFEDFFEDFPLFPLIFGFVLFRLFSVLTGKNKRGPVPMPMPKAPERPTQGKTRDIGFKIPPLKGAPKTAQTEAQDVQTAEEDDEALDALRRDSYERHLAEKQEREKKMERERLAREHQKQEEPQPEPSAGWFSPDALRNAVIWSEILGKPRAMRSRQ